jgi:hypothetical protein
MTTGFVITRSLFLLGTKGPSPLTEAAPAGEKPSGDIHFTPLACRFSIKVAT